VAVARVRGVAAVQVRWAAAVRVREAAVARVRARGSGGCGFEWEEERRGWPGPARSRVRSYADGLAVGIAGAIGVSFFLLFTF
jgi:hypothetical protein